VVEITRHIREQLPGQKDSIDRLVAEDSEFLALCDDYDACVDALHFWASSEEPGAKTRAGEYRDLIGALYEEITQILEKNPKRRQD
jgi:hypothetical protein